VKIREPHGCQTGRRAYLSKRAGRYDYTSLELNAAFVHTVMNSATYPNAEHFRHSSGASRAPVSTAKRSEIQINNDQRSPVNAKIRNAGLDIERLDQFRRHSQIALNNLVNPLATQVVFLGNLLERCSTAALRQNVFISGSVCSRTRPQWAPFPSRNLIQSLDPVVLKQTFPRPLPDVTNPSTQSHLFTIEDLDVGRRDFAVPGPHPEVVECCDITDESVSVVHMCQTIVKEIHKNIGEQKVIQVVDGGGKGHNGRHQSHRSTRRTDAATRGDAG